MIVMSDLKKKIKRVVVKSRILSPLYNVYLKIVTFRGDNNFVKIGKGCNFKYK